MTIAFQFNGRYKYVSHDHHVLPTLDNMILKMSDMNENNNKQAQPSHFFSQKRFEDLNISKYSRMVTYTIVMSTVNVNLIVSRMSGYRTFWFRKTIKDSSFVI